MDIRENVIRMDNWNPYSVTCWLLCSLDAGHVPSVDRGILLILWPLRWYADLEVQWYPLVLLV